MSSLKSFPNSINTSKKKLRNILGSIREDRIPWTAPIRAVIRLFKSNPDGLQGRSELELMWWVDSQTLGIFLLPSSTSRNVNSEQSEISFDLWIVCIFKEFRINWKLVTDWWEPSTTRKATWKFFVRFLKNRMASRTNSYLLNIHADLVRITIEQRRDKLNSPNLDTRVP